jgi:hypothetical protein
VVNGSYEDVPGATTTLSPQMVAIAVWLRVSLVLPDCKPSLVLPDCN